MLNVDTEHPMNQSSHRDLETHIPYRTPITRVSNTQTHTVPPCVMSKLSHNLLAIIVIIEARFARLI